MVSTRTIVQPTATRGRATGGSNSGQKFLVVIPPHNNPYARPGPKKCFRCNQPGHRSNQCPRRQTVNLVETETGEEVEDYEDEETGNDDPGYEATEVFADEAVLLSRSLVIQRVLLVSGQEDQA